ncbi:MAG: NADH:ubiquinone reductase (Na(+)-transporting) subunit F, partial [Bacteroidales bacterium]|nr:NADH:ubiquinone reductase (Na(+)-transporting) subunit F [Bacteroidales bacterium]
NPGICSSYIFTLKPNDKIFISGPYGDFHIKDSCREIIFIGGGAGMAPMRSHINDLFLSKHTNRKVSFWYGARSLKEMFYQDDFIQIAESNPNFKFFTALSEPKSEDNWTGYAGFIHQVLFDNYLSKHDEPEEVEYYLCGPQLMTNAVLDMLKNLGVPDEMIAFDDFGN